MEFEVIQPKLDRPDVPEDLIFSRAGIEKEAFSFSTKEEITRVFHKNEVVLIDEVNFIPNGLRIYFLKEVMEFIERGGWFIASGMLYTSQGGEFLLPAILFDRAEKIYSLTATCQKCGV